MKKPIRVVLAPEMLLFYDSLSEKALTNNTSRILFHGISHKVEILRQLMQGNKVIVIDP